MVLLLLLPGYNILASVFGLSAAWVAGLMIIIIVIITFFVRRFAIKYILSGRPARPPDE